MKFNEALESIKTYEAGKPIELVVREYGIDKDSIVKLASNENPFGCSPKVKDAVRAIIDNMALYPDDSMVKLKTALSGKYEIKGNELIIGAGSDQVIEFAIHAKAHSGSKVLVNSVTFAMYEIYAKQVGAEIIRTASREHKMDEFYTLYCEHKPSIIFLCTPNNPTGDGLLAQEMVDFIAKVDSDTLVIVDGAYMEYARFKNPDYAVEPKDLIAKFDNVLFLGTFSKAYGLGGMRVGYGIAQAPIIEALYKVRPPFNITTLSLEAASVALDDEAFVQECIRDNFNEMARYEEFARSKGIDVIDSYTNFVTLSLPEEKNSSKIAQELLKKGMIVRDLSSYGLNAIRVTIGTRVQNDRFFELTDSLL
ncbi:MAG: histidinol-phosphate transaminase [Sulfuricurvum sp. GWF2_44_89]|uniref:Histidinol-phosphate aminotransferase n=1 Tax=Sulfuricurvum kujiense TaxID=148813 RepID=A0A2D3WQ33_9BACT|nr:MULTISPECIES: histidinol-phosphate transaminase [Sulfuricurvum]OHD79530.1 MAG: histidinol-phosphate transaminase [Sulfuricurvum sp. GWF2_44_89]OHD93283.1 MAG: histidinol-phosphate transaminase [Sulfuricurvum sp. RIFOXYD12_FULL_44_77]OHD98935.1 MAG: histidinol-phosphate transaminase [Sulfuricurvum sp. RIFOXYD2_FULL_44_160]DAB39369.1 MAG TPA: histidinol-phosphate transaminase [Sulfuricurvum kujiense]